MMIFIVAAGFAYGFSPYQSDRSTVAAVLPGSYDWPLLTVEFQDDNDLYTTGRGRLLTTWADVDTTDTLYTFDAVPHNEAYFCSRLEGMDTYWNSVTKGRIRIKTGSAQYLGQVKMPRAIRYYNPAITPDSVDTRLAELVYVSIKTWTDAGNVLSSVPDAILIYHAGVGQDFDFSNIYDETPFDIPSFYFDDSFLKENLPADHYDYLNALGLTRGAVLPEMQNQLGVNIGLRGTEMLLSGFLLGLPPLYDTAQGRSYAGIFALMDQGSNNAAGLVPMYPSAFERILLGMETPQLLQEGHCRMLAGQSYKLPINSSEYFLLEVRRNAGVFLDSLVAAKPLKTYADALEFYADSSDAFDLVYSSDGTRVVGVSDYNVTLPGNGLLIWHVNDAWSGIRSFGANPNGTLLPLLDLVEADGGDDIGKNYGILAGNVNQGWKYDMWFTDNPGYFDNNPHRYSTDWSDLTHPDTRSFAGAETGIQFNDFSFTPDSVTADIFLSGSPFLRKDTDTYWMIQGKTGADEAFIGLKDSSLVRSRAAGIESLLALNEPADPAVVRPVLLDSLTLLLARIQQGFLTIDKVAFDTDGTRLSTSNLVSDSVFPADSLLDLRSVEDTLYILSRIADGKRLYRFDETGGMQRLDTGHDTDIRAFVVPDGQIRTLLATALLDPDYSTLATAPAGWKFGGVAGIGDSLLLWYDEGGYSIFHAGQTEALTVLRPDIQITSAFPVYADGDGRFDIAAVAEMNGLDAVVLLDQSGHQLTGWPVYGEYSDLRAGRQGDDLRLFALNAKGQIRQFDSVGHQLSSLFSSSPDPASFFLAQSADSVMLVSNGNVWPTACDSAPWACLHGDMDASAMMNEVRTGADVSGDDLILHNLIYNYPNPVNGDLTRFRYTAVNADRVEIFIYDYAGKFVEHLQQIPVKGQVNEILWKTDGLASGVYIARVRLSGAGTTKQIILKPAVIK